jgi:hypothetical protein
MNIIETFKRGATPQYRPPPRVARSKDSIQVPMKKPQTNAAELAVAHDAETDTSAYQFRAYCPCLRRYAASDRHPVPRFADARCNRSGPGGDPRVDQLCCILRQEIRV